MIALDVKDRKILDVLDENGRTPLSEIAKRVRLSKQVVDYRVRRMQKAGVIRDFTINCDLSRLGYSNFGVYLRLRKASDQAEGEVLDVLVNHPFTKWVVVSQGKYDFGFAMVARNLVEFNNRLDDILVKLSNNVENYETNLIISMQNFYAGYSAQRPLGLMPEIKEHSQESAQVRIDALDVDILLELQNCGRKNVVEIARAVKSSADVVRYRIRGLVAHKVLSRFKARISHRELGLDWYQMLIDLKGFPQNKKAQFTERLRAMAGVAYIVRCMGKWDFELHIRCKGNEELRSIIQNVRAELQDHIVNYETMLIFKKHKSVSIPPGVAHELKKSLK